MFCPAKKGYTEEDYYFSEWTAAERENGEHLAVMKFVRSWNPSRFALLDRSWAHKKSLVMDSHVSPLTQNTACSCKLADHASARAMVGRHACMCSHTIL